MYCHCLLGNQGNNNDNKFKACPVRTQVDKDGVCIHCNHYAMRNILLNENRASNNKISDKNDLSKVPTLLELWRIQRGDDVSA
jgi:hypothetical protein